MKKYKVTVNGTAYEVTVEEMDASSVATENFGLFEKNLSVKTVQSAEI